MTIEKFSVEWNVPKYFLELARECEETLPEVLVAEIEIADDQSVHIKKITGADGREIDQSWMSEYAGYQFCMAEQIRLKVIYDKGWEKRIF